MRKACASSHERLQTVYSAYIMFRQMVGCFACLEKKGRSGHPFTSTNENNSVPLDLHLFLALKDAFSERNFLNNA
ncbi:hypothetical protein TNCV_4696861 [Trichonephila clavipes]|nr:hypothetical protein TNCV_4696861 [Trichonephila clavipes]